MKKLGFIGCGKMASAIISGCISSNNFDKNDIIASEISENARNIMQEKLGIKIYDNNIDVIKNCDIVIFCVKPFVIKNVLNEIKDEITEKQLVISIAAGIKIETIQSYLKQSKIIRVMPNTPAMVKEGMSAICPNKDVNDAEKNIAQKIMSSVGETVFSEEKYIDIITSLSGSGPAFYYKIINDMAKSASKMGLDYDIALKLSAQTAIGSGKMILNSGIAPDTLIDNVTTKGGCTEVGNDILNNSDIEKILDETIIKTAQKAKELG